MCALAEVGVMSGRRCHAGDVGVATGSDYPGVSVDEVISHWEPGTIVEVAVDVVCLSSECVRLLWI